MLATVKRSVTESSHKTYQTVELLCVTMVKSEVTREADVRSRVLVTRRIVTQRRGIVLKWLECACRAKHVTHEADEECVMHVTSLRMPVNCGKFPSVFFAY